MTAYLVVDDAAQAIDDYSRNSTRRKTMRFGGPIGKIAHAELKIAGVVSMLAEAHPERS